MELRNVGNHAEDLADGRMIVPGETVELSDADAKDPRNKDLIDRGVLAEFEKKKGKETT